MSCPEYNCRRAPTSATIAIDGDLTKPFWADVERSSCFGDMRSGQRGSLRSQGALQWDDECLYAGFRSTIRTCARPMKSAAP